MCLTVHGLLAEADAHPQLHPMSHSCLRLKSTSAARCCRQANVHSFRRLYVAFAFSGTPATSFVPCAVACLLSSSFFQPQYCPPATRVTPCCIVLFCGCWLDLGSPCLVLLFNLYHYSPALICLQVGSQSWRGALCLCMLQLWCGCCQTQEGVAYQAPNNINIMSSVDMARGFCTEFARCLIVPTPQLRKSLLSALTLRRSLRQVLLFNAVHFVVAVPLLLSTSTPLRPFESHLFSVCQSCWLLGAPRCLLAVGSPTATTSHVDLLKKLPTILPC